MNLDFLSSLGRWAASIRRSSGGFHLLVALVFCVGAGLPLRQRLALSAFGHAGIGIVQLPRHFRHLDRLALKRLRATARDFERLWEAKAIATLVEGVDRKNRGQPSRLKHSARFPERASLAMTSCICSRLSRSDRNESR